MLLALSAAAPAGAQALDPLAGSPDHLRRYTECMKLARSEPLKALPAAEKWMAEGGGLGARHCVALAMFETGKHVQAATQFEAIARDMGQERPGLRAELWVQAGQAWMEARGRWNQWCDQRPLLIRQFVSTHPFRPPNPHFHGGFEGEYTLKLFSDRA